MKKEEIETRDQELINKFRTIIQNKEVKPAPKKFPFGLIFLFTVLIISSILILKQQSATLFSTASESSSRAQLVPVPVPEKKPVSTAAAEEITVPSDAPKVLAPPQKMAARKTVQKSSNSILSNPVPDQNVPIAVSNRSVQSNIPPGIRIEKILSCSSVKNRQHSRSKVKFSLAQDATPMIWMKVISENPSFTLTHVYYFNGQKYCEVPLAIRYQRMRTWSSVTLRSPDHIGQWRVEVIADNGAKLDQVEFTVVK